MLSKTELRIQLRAHRAELARDWPDFAQRIVSFAGDLDIASHAIVAGYWPMGNEADPRALMQALAARGHSLALPRIEAKAAPLVFHRWREGEALVMHRFGMSEPHVDRDVVFPDVVLVPLLAFDARGHRLGYGGGFYDRTLEVLARTRMDERTAFARGPHIKIIGVAYDGQEIQNIPHENHDEQLDAVLTENGLREFARIIRGH